MPNKDVELNRSLLDELPKIASARTADALRNGLSYYERALEHGIFDTLPPGLKLQAYREAIAFIMAHDFKLSVRFGSTTQ